MGHLCLEHVALIIIVVTLAESKILIQHSYLKAVESSSLTNCADTQEKVAICYNETAVQICENGNGTQVEMCGRLKPFCENGVCSSTAKFQCPDDETGYFPDLNSCSKFHFCFEGTPTTYNCDDAFTVYSSKLRSCAQQSLEHQCHRFRCIGRRDGYGVPYSGDPSIYTLCRSNKPFTIKKCPSNLIFSSSSQSCETVCLEEGNIKNPDDCQSYYSCIKVGLYNFHMKPMSCPNGTWFNPDVSYCDIDEGVC